MKIAFDTAYLQNHDAHTKVVLHHIYLYINQVEALVRRDQSIHKLNNLGIATTTDVMQMLHKFQQDSGRDLIRDECYQELYRSLTQYQRDVWNQYIIDAIKHNCLGFYFETQPPTSNGWAILNYDILKKDTSSKYSTERDHCIIFKPRKI